MRAWLEAAEDKTLPSGSPSLKSQTPKTKWRRLARLFLRFYRGIEAGGRTASGIVITKVPVKSGFWRGVGRNKSAQPQRTQRITEIRVKSGLSARDFALSTARHQLLNRFSGRFPIVQDGVHLLGDGHFHPPGLCQSDGRIGGEDSLGDHAMHSGDDLGQFLAAAEFDAYAAIAR